MKKRNLEHNHNGSNSNPKIKEMDLCGWVKIGGRFICKENEHKSHGEAF